MSTKSNEESLEHLAKQLKTDNTKLRQDYKHIIKEHMATTLTITQLQLEVEKLAKLVGDLQQEQRNFESRHTIVISELNQLKESIMNSNKRTPTSFQPFNHLDRGTMTLNDPGSSDTFIHNNNIDSHYTKATIDPAVLYEKQIAISLQRNIPPPSKALDQDAFKKKDNRLTELKRLTQEHMSVSDEEAGLRLYKLQKTMPHVVATLKSWMLKKGENTNQSWKLLNTNTQHHAFVLVECEAAHLGVPLNICIGYWGARRFISKSWANSLRTAKKHDGDTIVELETPHDLDSEHGDTEDDDDDKVYHSTTNNLTRSPSSDKSIATNLSKKAKYE